MMRNYFKMAWRSLNRHKLFSLVNISGVAIGIAAFWVIALYVVDELSYDRYHVKADRVFRVVQHGRWGKGSFDLAVTSAPYAPTLKADYPEVEDAVRIDPEGGGKISFGEKQIEAPDVAFADNSLFNLFTYHFLDGDPKSALANPHCIVLTKTLAQKLFSDPFSAVGKTIFFDRNDPVNVTGVMEDVPPESHFSFSAFRSFNSNFTDRWANADLFTYVLLRRPDDHKKIEAASPAFYDKYLKTELAGIQYRMELQPLTSVHLHSHLQFEMGNNGSMTYIYVFSIVALLILSLAIINYVNLTTARSIVRIKEIGIRKVIGSGRLALVFQFFSESVLVTLLAAMIGIVLVQLSLPFFNQLSGKTLDVWQLGPVRSVVLFAGVALVSGFFSGLYPALFLSRFAAIPAMKGQMGNQSTTLIFRKSLVTFQFVITILMIVGSTVLYRQLHYMMNRDLGFNKSRMLSFHIRSHTARQEVEALKAELLRSPLIESAAAAGNPIGNNDIGETDFNLGPDGNTAPDTKIVEQLIIDEDFIPAMQIKLFQGRNFEKGAMDSAQNAIIINQTLASELGWKDPVGMRVRTGVDKGVLQWSTIVGVIRDFNSYSLQHKIAPMKLMLAPTANDKDNLYVRVSGRNIPAALDYVRAIYHRFDPDNALDYQFLDQNFARQYQTEQKQGSFLLIFTILSICIACLGLFGLVTFAAQQRVKEIGIRKVLGASAASIVTLLSREIVYQVILATAIATPIAWLATNKWLQGFAYRTANPWWVFAGAGFIVLLITFLTISIRSVKAAFANPVESLRSE